MGVSDLWSVLLPGISPRVPFPVFVAHFLATHGRPPRLAIDGFMFLFQLRPQTQITDDIVIRNFISKLCYFLLYSVSYVVVLDGPNHLRKLRHNQGHDDDINLLAALGEDRLFNGDILLAAKLAMRDYGIQFIQSPGEAEAECAFMQRSSMVDFVVSDDVDTLVFGATKMLRNFLRRPEDKPAPSAAAIGTSSSTSSEFFVTPVDMKQVEATTGLDASRLVFTATLRGGDYSTGVSNIGITRAIRLALCGTKFASFYHRSPTKAELKKGSSIRLDPPPDFSSLLIDCIVEPGLSESGCKIPRLDQERRIRLQKFLKFLNSTVKDRFREIFERMARLDTLTIEEQIVMAYLFPSVNKRRFLFKNDVFSNGTADYIPSGVFLTSKQVILKLIKRKTVQALVTATKTIHNEPYVRIKYSVNDVRKITQEKEVWEQSIEQEQDSDEETPNTILWQSLWFPRKLIEWADILLLQQFGKAQVKPSIKPKQKTTLDELLKNRKASTTKIPSPALFLLEEEDSPSLVTSSLLALLNKALNPVLAHIEPEIKLSPTKRVYLTRKPPVKRNKSPIKQKKILPGQTVLTSFFNKMEPPQPGLIETNPFLVDEIDIPRSQGESLISISNKLGSELSLQSKRSVSAGLAETSPTKKLHLQLSPDSSPSKSTRLPSGDIPSSQPNESPIKKRFR